MGQQSSYEELLAEYSNKLSAIALLRQHRPYLEMIPSMRRPQESLITLALPVVRVRKAATLVTPQLNPTAVQVSQSLKVDAGEVLSLPCDVAILMCDPEWKIKTGVEVFVFIHRPHEDFSGLLGRWRQTQILLDQGYEWLLPPRYRHIFGEGADNTYPLFVVFDDSADRIKRGLKGNYLPFVVARSQQDATADVTNSHSEVDPALYDVTQTLDDCNEEFDGWEGYNSDPSSDQSLEFDS